MRAILTSLAIFVVLPAARAAGQQAPPPIHVDITVTAERAPQPVDDTAAAVSRLDADAIAHLPATSLPEALATLPGIRILNPHSYAGAPLVIMRGFFGGGEAEYVQLRVDGAPLGDAESGLAPWRTLGLGQIGALEQFRGSGSSLYGDTAMAGVIELVPPVRRRNGARALVAGGTFDSVDAELNAFLGRGPLDGSLDLLHRRSGGFRPGGGVRDTTVHGRAAHGGAVVWEGTFLGQRTTTRDPGPLRAAVFGADPDAAHPAFRRDADVGDRLRGTLTLRGVAGGLALAATVFAGRRSAERTRTVLLVPEVADTAVRRLSSGVLGGSLELQHDTSLFGRVVETRGGLETRRRGLESEYVPIESEGPPAPGSPVAPDRRELAAFASLGLHLSERVRTYGGVRWDALQDEVGRARVDATAWSPRAGVAVRVAGSTSAYAQVARAFKAPTLDQRYDDRPFPDFRGGSFTIANPRLEPQRSTSVEAGVRGSGRLRWSAVAYRMTVEDEIDFDAATFTYGNIGRSRHAGLELDASWDASSWISLSGAYTWMAVTPFGAPTGGRQLKNIPRHILQTGIDVRLPASWRAHVRYLRAAGAFVDDGNRVGLPGPSTFDARIEHARGRMRLFVDLLNLTNHRYAEYGFTLGDLAGGVVAYLYPAAGAAARAGLDVRF